MKLVPVTQSFQSLIDQWFTADVAGQKELSSYMNLESWMNLLHSSTRWAWIAYEGDEAIGFLDLEKAGIKGYFSVYLAPQYRGQGKSRLLLQTLIEEASKHGIKQLEAGAEESNIASQKALLAIGFTENGRDKDNYRVFTLALSE